MIVEQPGDGTESVQRVLRPKSGHVRLIALCALIMGAVMLAGCQPAGSVLVGNLTDAEGQHRAGIPVVVYSSTSDTVVAATITDNDGDYSFSPKALADGTYRIRFSTADWWEGASDWTTATDVTVAEGATVSIDATVSTSSSASVSGTVTDATGTPRSGVQVTARNAQTNQVVASTFSKTGPVGSGVRGKWEFTGLPPGDYRFMFTRAGLTTRYSDSATSASNAPVITLQEGDDVTGLTTVLDQEATIVGQLYNGWYATGYVVGVFDRATGDLVGTDVTDGSGKFMVRALNSGDYTIAFAKDLSEPISVFGTASTVPTDGAPITLSTEMYANLGRVDFGAAIGNYAAPVSVTAVAQDKAVAVSWEAPPTTGGRGPVPGYVVTSSPGNLQCQTTGAKTCIVSGLTNFVEYSFTVRVDAPRTPASLVSNVATPIRAEPFEVVALPDAPLDQPYTAQLSERWGFTPATWTVANAEMLPPGITVASDGSISGTPLQSGAYELEVYTPLGGGMVTLNVTGSYDFSGITDVSTSGSVTCGIVTGTAYCWGDNTVGQLGNGTMVSGKERISGGKGFGPYKLPLTNVTDISVSDFTTCAVADGSAYCWGNNMTGAVGWVPTPPPGGWGMIPYDVPADAFAVRVPDKVDQLANVTSIDTDGNETCAVAGAKVYCWGSLLGNEQGVFGAGSVHSPYEVPLGAVTTVTDVRVGDGTPCAIADGSLYCWGENQFGQVGNGGTETVSITTPYQLPLTNVTSISTGFTPCAVANGKGSCWGNNAKGQVGNGTMGTSVTTPFELPLANVTSVTASDTTACAVADGKGYCWGDNAKGQVGNGAVGGNVTTPQELPLTNVTSVTTAADVSCAVADGKGYCWGDNYYGLVGNGSTSAWFDGVTTPFELPITSVSGFTVVSGEFGGNSNSVACAVATGDGLFCWGDNGVGQVGDTASPERRVLSPFKL